ncbi:hypothetical protein BHE74_00042075 [Ensete ventricosum]|nr:hypothetical protein BHE74_00042075 [Ensete ventricosum]
MTPVYRRPKSMKELYKTTVHKNDEGYYALQMIDLPQRDPDFEMWARWPNLKSLTQVWDDTRAASEFGRGILHPQLVKEQYALPSEVPMAQAAKQIVLRPRAGGCSQAGATVAEQRVIDLHTNNEKLMVQLVESTHRLELSDKELNDVRADLFKAQREQRSNGQVVGRQMTIF